jgi:hypothetical protein
MAECGECSWLVVETTGAEDGTLTLTIECERCKERMRLLGCRPIPREQERAAICTFDIREIAREVAT